MGDYLLVESRDPDEASAPGAFMRDAVRLAQAGHRLSVYLVQEGVLAAVRRRPEVAAVLRAGATVSVDNASMVRRALDTERLVPGVRIDGIDALAAKVLEAGVAVVWH